MGRSMLAAKHKTKVNVVSKAGYNTAIFGKRHLSDNYPIRPQNQGFEAVVIHSEGKGGQSRDY
jgi:arylsulfatase A-like enzyme